MYVLMIESGHSLDFSIQRERILRLLMKKGKKKLEKNSSFFFTLKHATTHHSLLLLSLLSYHRHCSAAITTQSKTLSPRFVANVATHSQ